MSLMEGKLSVNNHSRWPLRISYRKPLLWSSFGRINMKGMIWNSSCLGWKSGRQHEARGSGVIPTKISAKSDSFDSSDERALPADLLSRPAGRSRAFKRVFRNPVSGLSICVPSSAAASFLNQNMIFLSMFLDYFCSCR